MKFNIYLHFRGYVSDIAWVGLGLIKMFVHLTNSSILSLLTASLVRLEVGLLSMMFRGSVSKFDEEIVDSKSSSSP